MQYDFSQNLKEEENRFGMNKKNDYFSFHDGDNKIRVLSPACPIAQHFLGVGRKPATCFGEDLGCPHHQNDSTPARPKWLMWVLDYADSKVKLARMPYTIIKSIADLQKSGDYSFSDLPMPYDLTIQVQNVGTKEVKYTVIPARNNTSLEAKILQEYAQKKDVFEIVENIKAKETLNAIPFPGGQYEINPNEVV